MSMPVATSDSLFLRFPSRMADWTPQHRKQAAISAAWTRRVRRSPEGIAWMRVAVLLKTTDPRTLRLLACDLAAEVLPLYEERYPNDSRLAAFIEIGRRYAEGLATERERQRAARRAVAVILPIADRDGYSCPSTCAAEAAGFTLRKPAGDCIECVHEWVTQAHNGEGGVVKAQRLIGLIEARLVE